MSPNERTEQSTLITDAIVQRARQAYWDATQPGEGGGARAAATSPKVTD